MRSTRDQKGTGRTTRPVSAMPEAIRRRDRGNGPWRVEEGTPLRGDAWTDIDGRSMRVPFGDTPTARVVRAHEMIHAKVSPANLGDIVDVVKVTPTTIKAVEEVRVNLLAMSAGFDLDALVDGSERNAGRLLATSGSIRPLVETAVATMFTKGHRDLMRGVSDVDPKLAEGVGLVVEKVEQAIVGTARDHGMRGRLAKRTKGQKLGEALRRSMSSTIEIEIDEDGDQVYGASDLPVVECPSGFTFTLDVARLVDSILDGGPNEPGDVLPSADDPEDVETSPIGRRVDTWAPLVWDRSVALNRHAPNVMGRRRARTSTGRVPRRVDLLLTDPERRIFSRDVRSTGGIVLIDQSGSMGLSIDDVENLVAESAGCVVIGYSHRPNSRPGSIPNVWTLADRGRVASSVRRGNIGNGCDRPALDHVLSIRRGSEPIVWVCDGAVTYRSDSFASVEDRVEIARLVARHGVHMVDTVDEAVEALRRSKSGRLPARVTGALVGGISDGDVLALLDRGGRR